MRRITLVPMRRMGTFLDALHPPTYQLLLLEYQKTATQLWKGHHATHGDQFPISVLHGNGQLLLPQGRV